LKDYYLKIGGKIFGSKNNFIKEFLRGAKFDHRPLEGALREVFGETELGSDALHTGLCIVAKRADTFSIWPVINHPGGKYYQYNAHIKLWELLRATSAAPSYFEPMVINVNPPDKEPEYASFIDGGVSAANNPSLQLLLLAYLQGFPFHWPLGQEDLLMVSVGTGAYRKKHDHQAFVRKNLIQWAQTIPNLFMEDASYLNQSLLQLLSNSPTAVSIDSEIGDLKRDLLGGAALLTYQRYNSWLETDYLNALNLSFPFDEKLLESMREMSNAQHRERLAEIGEKDAAQQIKPEHFPEVFDLNHPKTPARKFKKYDEPDLPFGKAVKKSIPIRFYQMEEPFEVETLEGNLRGETGDYLMVGVEGELYPCSKRVFEKTYEVIEE